MELSSVGDKNDLDYLIRPLIDELEGFLRAGEGKAVGDVFARMNETDQIEDAASPSCLVPAS